MRSQFLPSTMWILGIEFRLYGLMVAKCLPAESSCWPNLNFLNEETPYSVSCIYVLWDLVEGHIYRRPLKAHGQSAGDD